MTMKIQHPPALQGSKCGISPGLRVFITTSHGSSVKQYTYSSKKDLYEARRTARTDLSKFLEKITEIDPTCGLAQTGPVK